MGDSSHTIADLVFVGLNRRVIALDRYSGEEVWVWKAPRTGGFMAVLVDGDRLIASAGGYIHCLDPLSGQEVWSNPLTGYGLGVSCLASIHGTSAGSAEAAAAAAAAAARQAATAG